MKDARIPSALTDRQLPEVPASARTYQLLIEIDALVEVRIGRLGSFCFPAGLYMYTGSARRHLRARVLRHLAQHKKMHWHIDYLLAAPGVRIRAVNYSAEDECRVNQSVSGEVLVCGFGASDCRAGCGSHLKKLPSTAGENQS